MSSKGMPNQVSVQPGTPPAAPTPTVDDRAWRDHVLSPWKWDIATNQTGSHMAPNAEAGEAGGFMVATPTLPHCRGYLKPLKKAESVAHARAAREKIVSDLAHDLRVAVPPVVLVEREACPPDEESFVCVSRVMHPRQWSWMQVKRLVVDHTLDARANAIVMKALPRSAARGIALDAWVDQADHNDHPHNIVFGYAPSATPNGEFVFLDFAWSLGFPLPRHKPNGWEGGAWNETGAPLFPPHMARYIDKDALEETVAAIEIFDDQLIRDIVSRIPDTFMAANQKTLAIEGLIGRKPLVRQMLALHLKRRTA